MFTDVLQNEKFNNNKNVYSIVTKHKQGGHHSTAEEVLVILHWGTAGVSGPVLQLPPIK